MKLSVVVCTYRGEAWIGPQLTSIVSQTRPADQIVVRDDCSPDATMQRVRTTLESTSADLICVENTNNLGCTGNFAAAIADATGDVIVLADQDDVWLPHKLATIERRFTDSTSAGMVFSDAALVDEQLVSLGQTLWNRLRVTPRERRTIQRGEIFETLLRRNLVTGATMAFRSEYRDLVLPIPPTWVHDAWIALLIAAVAPCLAIDEPLIQYRQHALQQIGERRRGWYGQYLKARQMGADYFQRTADNFALAAERLRLQTRHPVRPEVLEHLDAKVNHWRHRAEIRQMRWRFPRVVTEWGQGHYGWYSLGWKSMAQDLFL